MRPAAARLRGAAAFLPDPLPLPDATAVTVVIQPATPLSQSEQGAIPAFAELGPYAVAYVDLDEGFRIMTNIVGVPDPTRDIQCGMRVQLRWHDQGEGQIALPMFEPA